MISVSLVGKKYKIYEAMHEDYPVVGWGDSPEEAAYYLGRIAMAIDCGDVKLIP